MFLHSSTDATSVICFSPFFILVLSQEKKRITFIFGLLVLFGIKPSSSQHLSSTPIFNSYETSNYAAIQVAFHKTVLSFRTWRGALWAERTGCMFSGWANSGDFIIFFRLLLHCFKSRVTYASFKCILMYQIRRTNDCEHTLSWQIITKSSVAIMADFLESLAQLSRWDLLTCVVLIGIKFGPFFCPKTKLLYGKCLI